jgi:ABC-2 type transport system ATP-binding protein
MNFSEDRQAEIAAEIAADPQGDDVGRTAAARRATQVDDTDRHGDRAVEILDTWIESVTGEAISVVPYGGRFTFAMRVRANEDSERPLFGLTVETDQGAVVFEPSSVEIAAFGAVGAGETRDVRIAFDNILAPGRFYLTPFVAKDESGLEWHDRRPRMNNVLVTGTVKTLGPVHPHFDMAITPPLDPAVVA